MHRGSPVITLVVTCLGTFLVPLDMTIIVTALPTIQSHLHTNFSDLQWAIDAFSLPFAALMLTGGTLGDRFGRKRFFQFGLVLFLIGSVFCGFAPTLLWLLFGRVLQGVGTAALAPGSLSVLTAAFPERHKRAQAIGIWAGVSGIGLAVGPLAGGWLIGIAGWPAIFFVNLPVGFLVLALSMLTLAESRNPNAKRIDLPGQVLVIGTLLCLVLALIEGSSAGWTSPLILGLFGGFVVCLCAFLLVEALVREPMVLLHLFVNRGFSVVNLTCVVFGAAMTGTLFFVTQFLQNVQGYTAFGAGLRLLPACVGIFAVAPLAGQLTAHVGPRFLIVLGALLGATSLLLMAVTIQPDTSYATLWWQVGLFGVGCGFMFTPLTIATLSVMPLEQSGLGSSIPITFRAVGMTLGVAVLGAFILHQFPGNITFQLTKLGLPASVGVTIAERMATAGSGACQIAVPGHLSLAPSVLHQAICQAFVDTLRGTFLISAISLFASGLLVASLFEQKQPTARTRRTPAKEAGCSGLGEPCSGDDLSCYQGHFEKSSRNEEKRSTA